MKITLSAFQDELPGWALRGAVCALTSFGWALVGGFSHPTEIAGMILGVGFWVAVFALGTAWLPANVNERWRRLGRALKRAAWIKFAVTILGVPLVLGLLNGFTGRGVGPLAFVFMLDMMLGLAALWLVGQVGGFADFDQISRLDSCGWTALTVVVEGALMAAVIGLIALAVLGWWRLTAGSGEKQELSPARISG